MQMSSTEFTTYPGLQTNHLLNDKSEKYILYIFSLINDSL